VAGGENEDEKNVVVNLVNDTVVPDSNPPPLSSSRQLPGSVRPRLGGKTFDVRLQAV